MTLQKQAIKELILCAQRLLLDWRILQLIELSKSIKPKVMKTYRINKIIIKQLSIDSIIKNTKTI